MATVYVQDQTIEGKESLPKGEYENCSFNRCNFEEQDLSEYKFIDCVFTDCNLSLAKLHKTAFQDARFIACKLLGLRFDTCHDFNLSFSFERCQLNHSSFYKLKIKKTVFRNSQLEEVDFVEADLSGALFDQCNLAKATFENTLLEKADFRTAQHFSIDPETNRIKKARFSVAGLSGLLDKYDIDIER